MPSDFGTQSEVMKGLCEFPLVAKTVVDDPRSPEMLPGNADPRQHALNNSLTGVEKLKMVCEMKPRAMA